MTQNRPFSVSVAGIVVDERGRVLVTRRRDNGHWEAPGGILEPGESFEEGVAREIREETGLRVDVEVLTGVYLNRSDDIVALVYRCAPVGGVIEGSTDEVIESRWIDPSQAVELMTPAFAVRVTDAFLARPASRSHDGRLVLGE